MYLVLNTPHSGIRTQTFCGSLNFEEQIIYIALLAVFSPNLTLYKVLAQDRQ
jgi:hypothetical protein